MGCVGPRPGTPPSASDSHSEGALATGIFDLTPGAAPGHRVNRRWAAGPSQVHQRPARCRVMSGGCACGLARNSWPWRAGTGGVPEHSPAGHARQPSYPRSRWLRGAPTCSPRPRPGRPGSPGMHTISSGTPQVKQRRPLALQFRARSEPRVLRCVHPHVGAGPGGIPPFRDGLAVFAFSHGVHPGTPALEGQCVSVAANLLRRNRTRPVLTEPQSQAWDAVKRGCFSRCAMQEATG
jgi:hypothetical protein